MSYFTVMHDAWVHKKHLLIILPKRRSKLTLSPAVQPDNTGIGCAISLYIRQIEFWSKHHHRPAIVSCFVAYFRKHQLSDNPLVWFEVDLQFFASHLTSDTIKILSKDAAKDSGVRSIEICKNWNSEKRLLLEEIRPQKIQNRSPIIWRSTSKETDESNQNTLSTEQLSEST